MGTPAAEACAAGEWSVAIKLFTAALEESSPSPAPILCNRALCYSKLDLHRKALKDSEAALAADPSFVLAYLRQGAALNALGKRDAAAAAWAKGYDVAVATAADMELALRLRSLSLNSASASTAVGPTAAPSNAAKQPAGSAESRTTSGGPKEGTRPAAVAAAPIHTAANGHALSVAKGESGPYPAKGAVKSEARVPSMPPGRADVLLSLGIQQVNAGQLDAAVSTFEKILDADRGSVGAYIGRGTALALQHKLEAAVQDFTDAIAINPNVAEAWKRRAQARAALGSTKEAVDDCNRALEIDPTCSRDVLFERGTLQVKLKDFRSALQDLRVAVSMDPNNKMAHNFMGLALVGSGECVEGVRAYKRALQLDPEMHEAWLNLGQAHKELADAPKAAECFHKAISLDPKNVQTYRIFTILKYGCGDHRGAAQMAERGLEVKPSCIELHYLYASAMHALGEYYSAVRNYDEALGLEGRAEEHMLQFLAFYQREVALYTASKLNEPLGNFRMDDDLQPFFKEAWCKKLPPTLLFPGYTPQPMLPAGSLIRRKKDQSGVPPAGRQRLLDVADRIGRRTQYSCPGFLQNVRQHRMAGLAILEIMQTVSAAWQLQVKESGGGSSGGLGTTGATRKGSGKRAKGKGSSSTTSTTHSKGSAAPGSSGRLTEAEANGLENGSAGGAPEANGSASAEGSSDSEGASGTEGGERERQSPRAVPASPGAGAGAALGGSIGGLKWRDVFNITVRWRQISEPCDGVAWVDKLTVREFEAGFGSHTPILIGQTRVVRYYANFQRAFRIMKQQILQNGGAFNADNEKIPLSEPEQRRAVEAAKEPKELHDLVGQDFWVVTPCHSMAHPGKVLDGTRLTLVKSPTGFDFAIRTPGTPLRWQQYDEEMTAAWEELREALRLNEASGAGLSAPEREQLRERIQNAILRMGFYWYNFMPLARGTAMVGYATMLGLLMASNMEVTQPVPRGMQVDWEAILCPRFESFAATVRPWMLSELRSDSPFRGVAKVSEALPTIGSVVSALSASGDKQ